MGITLALFAIWQAWTLYRWSQRSEREAEKAANAIAHSVAKLEDLFDRLYSDTFGIMRDTVTDMRRHVWPEPTPSEISAEDLEKRAEERFAGLRQELRGELDEMLGQVRDGTRQLTSMETTLHGLIDRAIESSRDAEDDVQAERLVARSSIASAAMRALSAADISDDGSGALSIRQLAELTASSSSNLMRVLRQMQDVGLIEVDRLASGRTSAVRLSELGRKQASTLMK